MMEPLFPWQQKQWQQLWRVKQENSLAHALLFVGIPGVGKAAFADNFSRVLLCQSITSNAVASYPCYTCHSCRLIEGKTHPNVLWVEPEKKGQAIKVDQIRDVSDFINQSALQGDYRIVIIHPANAMNASAANALLKTLEEPPVGALLILISDQKQGLPATILSRCQRIVFPPPKQEEARVWLKQHITDSTLDIELLLKLAHGAPLAAMQLMQEDLLSQRQTLLQALYGLRQQQANPVTVAAKLQEMDAVKVIDFVLSWVMDLLRLQVNADKNSIINKDYEPQLAALAQQIPIKSNNQLMIYLQQLRGQISNGINLNKQLMIENILIKWMG